MTEEGPRAPKPDEIADLIAHVNLVMREEVGSARAPEQRPGFLRHRAAVAGGQGEEDPHMATPLQIPT